MVAGVRCYSTSQLQQIATSVAAEAATNACARNKKRNDLRKQAQHMCQSRARVRIIPPRRSLPRVAQISAALRATTARRNPAPVRPFRATTRVRHSRFRARFANHALRNTTRQHDHTSNAASARTAPHSAPPATLHLPPPALPRAPQTSTHVTVRPQRDFSSPRAHSLARPSASPALTPRLPTVSQAIRTPNTQQTLRTKDAQAAATLFNAVSGRDVISYFRVTRPAAIAAVLKNTAFANVVPSMSARECIVRTKEMCAKQ